MSCIMISKLIECLPVGQLTATPTGEEKSVNYSLRIIRIGSNIELSVRIWATHLKMFLG